MNTFVADLPELDIVDRLRLGAEFFSTDPLKMRNARFTLIAAAVEIETLRDEAERLRVTIDNLRIRLAQAEARSE